MMYHSIDYPQLTITITVPEKGSLSIFAHLILVDRAFRSSERHHSRVNYEMPECRTFFFVAMVQTPRPAACELRNYEYRYSQ